MSLGGTKAGRHTSLIKYIVLKSDYFHQNSSKATALLSCGRDPNLSCPNGGVGFITIAWKFFHFLTLGKKNTLDVSFLKFMRKNTAWHLILAAVSVQYTHTHKK